MLKALFLILRRAWFLYAFMAIGLLCLLDTNRIADDVLNASRPSGDYVQAFSYGLKEYNEFELRQAAAYYETLVAGNLKTPFIYANLGFCYFYLHDIPKAVSMYQKALERDQSLYAIHYDLGLIAMLEGENGKAAEYFQKSRAVLPGNRQELIQQFHINPKHWTSPVVADNAVFVRRLNLDTQLLYVYLSATYVKLKAYDQALALAGEGIGRYPTDPELYYTAGVASYSLGLAQDAALFLNRAIDLAPNYAEAYYARSQLMKALGREDLASADFVKSKECQKQGPWRHPKNTLDLHHWNDAILFFQLYH